MDKKAQFTEASKGVYMIIALFVILVMFWGLFSMFSKYISVPVVAHDQAYISVYQERFLSSPDCFAYQDKETGAVYPYVIDISKFNEERLNSCFKKGDGKYEFFFNLTYGGKESRIRTEDFRWLKKTSPIFVLVNDGNNTMKGKLLLSVGALRNE